MGLLPQDGTPRRAVHQFPEHAPDLGLCQWVHFEDHRLEEMVAWYRRLGVRYVRTGLSWADYYRPNALDWFDRQMSALAEFEVTVTFCYSPPSLGIMPDCASPPRSVEGFVTFCGEMTRRYAGTG